MDADLTACAKREALDRALVAAMDAAAREPMRWGVDDCALWCANVLRDALGYDAALRFRDRYRTRIGARRVLGAAGLGEALRLAARRHRWRRIRLGAEQVGDIGLVFTSDAVSTVICRAPGWFVARNEGGFTAIPARAVRIVWAIL